MHESNEAQGKLHYIRRLLGPLSSHACKLTKAYQTFDTKKGGEKMFAQKWIFVAFLVIAFRLELCTSHRPLNIDGVTNDETTRDDTASKNAKDGIIGTECDANTNNCGNCNHPAGCVVVPPNPVPVPIPIPPIVVPPIYNEPCLPPVPPIVVVPPIDHNEPCSPPFPPPIVIQPPFNCPVVEPCPRCDICVDYSKMDAAMAPAY